MSKKIAPENIKGKRGSYAGFVPSRKMGRMVSVMSRMAHQMAMLLETDPAITSYESQSAPFTIEVDGVLKQHEPTFVVERGNEILVIDVRPASKRSEPRVAARHSAIQGYCEQHGATFVAVDEEYLNQQPRMKNAEFLLRYAAMHFDEFSRKCVFEIFSDEVEMTIKEAMQKLDTPHALTLICSSVIAGDLRFNTSLELNLETLVSPKFQEEEHEKPDRTPCRRYRRYA